MFTSAARAIETPKGVIEKSRDYIHNKVATEEQLMGEKPLSEQIVEKMPADAKEAGEKLDATFNSAVQDVKNKFNERLDEGTARAESH